MPLNPGLDQLQPYPFERLAATLGQPARDRTPIDLAVGEPKFAPPAFVLDVLDEHRAAYGTYPTTRGVAELRVTVARWLERRYDLPADTVDPETRVLPVSGTREALFALCQVLCDGSPGARVLVPNPGYQIYEGAALLAGARPTYLDCSAASGWLPRLADVPPEVLDATQLVYLCSPGNPTGAVMPVADLVTAIELADRHDFLIVADECYAEIYPDDPPPGLLEACRALGRDDFARCLVCHSLSKRSSLPGLRSGFVAGAADLVGAVYRYRTYHGCTQPLPAQYASIAAWSDETHVEANRARYRENFAAALEVLRPTLPVTRQAGAFYLWPEVPGDDVKLATRLYAEQSLRVLPGSFMGRATGGAGGNPGARHLRMAMVAPAADCRTAAERLLECLD